jgi:hypothetical protein
VLEPDLRIALGAMQVNALALAGGLESFSKGGRRGGVDGGGGASPPGTTRPPTRIWWRAVMSTVDPLVRGAYADGPATLGG